MELSIETLLNHLSVSLVKNKKRRQSLSKIRLSVPSHLYGEFIDKIYQFPSRITKVPGNEPKRLKDIDDSPNLTFISVSEEMRWAREIILRNVDQINIHVQLSEKFSNEMLMSEYPQAADTLDEIEKLTGYSIWLIKNKIAFLQLSSGLEAQKRYSQFIKDETTDGSFAAYVAYWISVRNEETVTINRFASNFNSRLVKLARYFDPIDIKYFGYHIFPPDELSTEDYANFLCIDFSKSIHDYYEAFVALSRSIVMGYDDSLKSQLRYSLLKINKVVKDSRLDFYLELISTNKSKIVSDEDFKSSLRHYELGSYTEALESFNKSFLSRLTSPITSIIGAFILSSQNGSGVSLAMAPKCLAVDIIVRLANILRNGFYAAAEDTNRMQKMALNFSSFPWASAIRVVLIREETFFLATDDSDISVVLKVPFPHIVFLEDIYESGIKTKPQTKCWRSSG